MLDMHVGHPFRMCFYEFETCWFRACADIAVLMQHSQRVKSKFKCTAQQFLKYKYVNKIVKYHKNKFVPAYVNNALNCKKNTSIKQS